MSVTVSIGGMGKVVDGGFVRVDELYAVACCSGGKFIVMNIPTAAECPHKATSRCSGTIEATRTTS